MALYSPILNEFNRSYDVDVEDVIITFSYLISDTFDKLNVVVENYNEDNNEDLEKIYDNNFVVSNLKTNDNHIILPKNIFVNGNKYYIRIRAVKNDGSKTIYSEFSARCLLKCFKAAIVKIDKSCYDIIDGNNIVSTEFLNACGSYFKCESADGKIISDDIKWFKFDLYKNSNKNVSDINSVDVEKTYQYLETSGEIRTTQTDKFLYRFIDLENNMWYKVILTCCSKSNLKSQSVVLEFHTNMIEVNSSDMLSIHTDKITGDVTMTTKISQSSATSDTNIEYTMSQEADLRDGSQIFYKKGLDLLNANFVIQIWIRDPIPCKNLIYIADDSNNSKDKAYIKYSNGCFHLFITSHGVSSHYRSQPIFENGYELKEDDILYLYIKYVGNTNVISMTTGIKKKISEGDETI